MAFEDGGLVGAFAIGLVARLASLMAAAALYHVAVRFLARPSWRGDGVLLGVLLGAGAGIAMLLPGPAGALGAGIAGIGVAGLLGSGVGAGIAASVGVLAFSAVEPAGTLAGLTALMAAAPLGRLLARIARRQRRVVGLFDLAVLGAILALVSGLARGGLADATLALAGALAAGALVLQERTAPSQNPAP